MPNPDYRKMFGDLDAYYPERDDLDSLALIMSGQSEIPDTEKMLEHSEELVTNSIPEIPSGYTYLGQFISHDISFDEASDRHIREDFPWEIIDPKSLNQLRNLRQPDFNLETVYGHENPANRGEIARAQLMLPQYKSTAPSLKILPLLKLGNTKGVQIPVGTANSDYPNDLPRGNACVEARIVDPRNDENLLLAQTHVAFIKFHNAMVVKLSESKDYKYEELFEKARKLTIRYYQTIILTDFLPRIISESVLKDAIARVKPVKSFYRPDMFMPLEFSVAAFRFAHSMIRNSYQFNSTNTSPKLEELMMFTGRGEMGFGTHSGTRLKLPSNWIINWNLFYEIDDSKPNLAENIDTKLSIELTRLISKPLYKSGGRANLLAILDLYRGRRFGLPTGQDVARKIGVTSLSVKDIEDLIMSKKIIDSLTGEEPKIQAIKENLCKVFGEQTPLWFYILAEAEIQAQTDPQNAGKLGLVGSTIIAETFVQLLNNSEYSILQHEWEDESFLLRNEGTERKFGMTEMLKFIQEMTEQHYKELYPTKFYPQTINKFDELNPLEKGYQNTN